MNIQSIPEFSNAPFRLIALDETDSTSNYLTRLCQEQNVTEYTTVTARYQSAGKGQRGNHWEAEPGRNLLFSFVLYPTFLEARRQFVLSQLVALSVKEELSTYTDGIRIKWPNDIYYGNDKICGMLLENDLNGHTIARCIAGIGVNINQETFHSDAPNPISLKQITGQVHDINAILYGIMQKVNSYYTLLQASDAENAAKDIARRYAAALYRNTGYHTYADAQGRFNARLLRVEPDGRFVLEDEKGQQRSYLFKEVQYVLNENQ